MDDSKNMKKDLAVLFPHSFLTGKARDKILSSFAALTVCKPWYMDENRDEGEGHGPIHIIRPAEALRPPQDFLKLLAEYRLWMSQNPGYGLTGTRMEENATWEIRRSLRQADRGIHAQPDEPALRWHLILHLHRELEEHRISAEEMLLQVKSERSPLADALGEALPSQGLLDDVPVAGSYPSVEERRLKQVMAGWFGLFGPSVPDNAILVTMAHEVLTYAADLFEIGLSGIPPQEVASPLCRIHLPRSSHNARLEKDPVYGGLSGKTLVFMNGH